MPQPITKLEKNPHVVIDEDALAESPEMAALVCRIFALWASIERELRVLLVRLLGANAAPAHAIFSILQTQALQTKALEAAARNTLNELDFEYFSAFMSVIGSVQKTRNKLAHWSWAACQGRPDLLLLGDPEMLKVRDTRAAAFFQTRKPGDPLDYEQAHQVLQFEDSSFLAFTKSDLEREARDLRDAEHIATIIGMYFDPTFSLTLSENLDREDIRKGAAERLEKAPLMKAALLSLRSRQSSR